MLKTWFMLVSILAFVTGCASQHSVHAAHPPAEPLPERAEILAKADWSKTENVHIELRDQGFVPKNLKLKAMHPYRLTIVNNGSNTHYFDAPEFLRDIATRKVEVKGQAEIKAEYFSAFEVMRRGGEIELYFIPAIKGSYRVHCHLENHAAEGVEGTITVE
jgi:uncharacterized cupredoxin-like copper-binding protein